MKRILVSLILLLLIVSCAFVDGLLATPTQPAPTPTATLPPSPTPTASPFPTATSTLEPSPIPEAIAILVSGSDAFVTQTNAALDLLQQCAPVALATADQFLDAIQESDRSGMEVETDTFLASLTTAFAPDYSLPAQVFWYAGSIIHDARHSWQSDTGMTTNWSILTLSEREAIEADARGVQIAALELCVDFVEASALNEIEWMVQYLVDMQTGVIPCDYCEVEWADRDW
jgi:hypothetical protein